jgi:hypothetical protein
VALGRAGDAGAGPDCGRMKGKDGHHPMHSQQGGADPKGSGEPAGRGGLAYRGRAGAGRMQSALGLPQVLEWDKGVIGNEPSMTPHEDGERRAAGGAGRGGQGCSNSTEGSSRG